jgi:hypothetical protein
MVHVRCGLIAWIKKNKINGMEFHLRGQISTADLGFLQLSP